MGMWLSSRKKAISFPVPSAAGPPAAGKGWGAEVATGGRAGNLPLDLPPLAPLLSSCSPWLPVLPWLPSAPRTHSRLPPGLTSPPCTAGHPLLQEQLLSTSSAFPVLELSTVIVASGLCAGCCLCPDHSAQQTLESSQLVLLPSQVRCLPPGSPVQRIPHSVLSGTWP